MPTILTEIYRLQKELTNLDPRERLLLKMCANALEGYHHVRSPQNRLTDEEYLALPQRWEVVDGMLRDYHAPEISLVGWPGNTAGYRSFQTRF